MRFTYKPDTHLLQAEVSYEADQVRGVGDVIGACGGKAWDPAEDVGLMELKGSVYQLLLQDVKAGGWEWKIALNGAWDVNYGQEGAAGGDNIKLLVEGTS